jgi:Family of unknown function (DUF6157)
MMLKDKVAVIYGAGGGIGGAVAGIGVEELLIDRAVKESMNYYNTLIEVANDCPVTEAIVPKAKVGKRTKPVIEYEMIANHPYKYTEGDIAFELYAVLRNISKAIWPKERQKFLSKGHPHLRVSALAKRYGWGIHNNAEGKTALIAVESPEYKKLMNDARTVKIRAFRSKRA